jgi:hypothetical protein
MAMDGRSTSSRKLALVAAASAAFAAAVVAAIYEIKPQGRKRTELSVAAALLGGSSSGSGVTPREPAASLPAASDPGAPLRSASERCSVVELEQAKGSLDVLQREKRDLEAQVQALENEIGRPGELTRRLNAEEFELTQEDWKELAARGRVKYRVPCQQRKGSANYTRQSELDQLGISPDDGKVLGEAHQRSNDRVWSKGAPALHGRDRQGRGGLLSAIDRRSRRQPHHLVPAMLLSTSAARSRASRARCATYRPSANA